MMRRIPFGYSIWSLMGKGEVSLLGEPIGCPNRTTGWPGWGSLDLLSWRVGRHIVGDEESPKSSTRSIRLIVIEGVVEYALG